MSSVVANHPHHPPPIRLGSTQRRWLHLSIALLWMSGALWLVFHYFLWIEGDFGPQPHALEPWWLRLHGLAMMATLVALGSVVVHHAGRAWQLHRNTMTGALLAAAFGWLAASGYALYYFSSDANQAWLPLLHWLPGLGLPVLLGAHAAAGRARRRSPAAAPRWRARREPQPSGPPAFRGTSASGR